jgi:hypothetical protein
MFRFSLSAALLLLLTQQVVYAQHDKQFKLIPFETKISDSRYNSLHVIDSRTDKSNLGLIRVGAFDRKTKLTTDTSLSVQLSKWFNANIDQKTGSGKLVLHLRQFFVLEASSIIGNCILRAGLYKLENNRYSKIRDIDTLIGVRSGLDVTDKLLKQSSSLLTNFIAQSTVCEPLANTESFSYDDLTQKLDSLEKKQLKLYNTATYTDGLYLTYNSFKRQVADKNVVVQHFNFDDINLADIKAPDEKGKLKEVNRRKIYGFVFMGQPYIAGSYAYCTLKKVKDEFIFTGEINNTMPGDPSQVGLFFGAVVYLFAILYS